MERSGKWRSRFTQYRMDMREIGALRTRVNAVENNADQRPDVFAVFMPVAAVAADGRDAVGFAPLMPIGLDESMWLMQNPT
jgi:folate-dependent tRNA-U54 methylase TrmFO/GidA